MSFTFIVYDSPSLKLMLTCSKTFSALWIKDVIVLSSSFCFSDQAEARRNKVKQSRLRREERQRQKREELLKQYAKEDDAAAKTAK